MDADDNLPGQISLYGCREGVGDKGTTTLHPPSLTLKNNYDDGSNGGKLAGFKQNRREDTSEINNNRAKHGQSYIHHTITAPSLHKALLLCLVRDV